MEAKEQQLDGDQLLGVLVSKMPDETTEALLKNWLGSTGLRVVDVDAAINDGRFITGTAWFKTVEDSKSAVKAFNHIIPPWGTSKAEVIADSQNIQNSSWKK